MNQIDTNIPSSIYDYFFLLLTSFVLTFLIIPLIIKFGEKFKFIDIPNNRKQHKISKINIGGLGLILGYLITILILKKYLLIFSYLNNSFWLIIFVSIALFFVGFIDDLLKLSPFLRIIIQVGISSYLWEEGFNLKFLDLSYIFNDQLFIISIPNFISWLITVLWFVGLINAINWMDGLDGLASGIIIISSIAFLIVNFKYNNYENTIIASLLIGISSAFFIFNKYPSKIIMGDGGSYFLGFSIASISLIGDHTIGTSMGGSYNSVEILIPILILFVPLFDMLFVIISRIFDLKSPFYPDRRHIHHRFVERGYGHYEAVQKIYLLTLPNIFLALFLAFFI